MATSNKRKGRLKIFLGYATGCGKTFTLLKEALALKQRNHEIAIAALTHTDRSGIRELASEFTVLPDLKKGLDVHQIIQSPFDTIIIDDLAMTNPTTSKNIKRYEDVMEILNAGKNVLTSVNVQHLDSVAERLSSTLCMKIQERVPDRILNEAESVTFVDLSIDELRERIKSEQVFPKDKAEQALFHFFTYENLCLLRKLALEVITSDQLNRINGEKLLGLRAREEADPGILAVLTEDEKSQDLCELIIHKTAKYAHLYSSHFFVVLVHPMRILKSSKNQTGISQFTQKVKTLTESLKGTFVEMKGPGLPAQIIELCHTQSIRHLVFGKEESASFIQKAIHQTRGIDVHLIDRPAPRGE